MNDNENLKSLYNTLQKEGYTPPVFEQFAKDMEDDDNLRGVYSTLQNEGYTPPDYDTFRSDMGFGKSLGYGNTGSAGRTESAGAFTQEEYDKLSPTAQEVAQGVGVAPQTNKPNKTNEPDTPNTSRMQFVPEAENVVMATPTAETLKKYPWLKADEAVPFDRNTGEPLHTWVDEQGNPISQRDLDVRRAKEEITGAKEQMRPAAASLQLPGETTRGVRLDGSISGYVDNMMKQQYGDDYANKQYTTKDGRQVSGAELLNETAQETYNELNEELRAARIDILLSDDEEQKKQLVDNLSKKWNGVISEQSLSEALNDEETAREDLVAMAGDEIEKARADERRIRAEMDRRGAELDSQTSPFADQTFNVRGVDSEYKFLTAELNAVQDRIRSWEAVRDSKDVGLLRGLANTAGNIRTWDLGMSDFNTGLALLTSRGKKRQELVNLLGGAQKAASLEDQTTNNVYRWAKIAGESLPFAATFMATGGGFANIGKVAGNRALRIAERRAIDGLAKNVVKNMGVGLGEVASSYLLATTAQGLGTAGDIMRRRTGEIQQGRDGNYELVNGNSWGEAIYKGATAAAIENYTEMLGAHINIGKNVMNFLPKIGMGRVSDWFLKAGKQNWYNTTKEWLSRMGVNGYGGEVLEEEIAIPLNAILVGDNPLLFGSGGLLDKDTQIDILGGMALSIAGMNAGTLAAYGTQRGVYAAMTVNDERRLNNADATALEVLGNKWNDIKDDIDNTPNDAMPELMKEYADDETMSKEEKEAVGGYITSLLRSRGHNLGQNAVIQADEEEQTVLDNNLTPEEQQNVHEDGMIHTALLYPTAENGGEPQEVFITKGNVVMRGDGTIDTEASSNAIYYKGSDGQVHMTSPDKIQSVNEPISVEEYAAAGAELTINNEKLNSGNDAEQYAVGDEVNVNIGGNNYTATVQGTDGNGNVQVYYQNEDGIDVPATFTIEELRNMNRPNDEQPPMGGAGAVIEEPTGQNGNIELQNIPENGNIGAENITQSGGMGAENGENNVENSQHQQQSVMPKDAEGNPIYDQAPVEATISDLYDGSLDDAEVQGFINANINEAQKRYDNTQKKAPKIGTNKAKYLEQKRKWQADVDEAKRVLDYWNEVNAQKESITHTTPQEIEAAQAELSGQNAREEYAAMNENVPTNAVAVASDFIRGAKITPESFRAETGYGAGEQRRFVGMIAMEQNGGKSIDRLAEELVSYDNAELNGITFNGDTGAAKDAILEALHGAGTRGELTVDNTAEQERYVDARRAELDAQYLEAYGMTYEDYLAYEEQNLPEMLRKYANFDEVEFYNLYADEIELTLNARINEQGNDTTGEEPRAGGGDEVLLGEGTDNARGSAGGTEQGTEVPTGVQGTAEDGTVSEQTSAGNIARKLDFDGRLERRRNIILENIGDEYSLSDEKADNGELFYQNSNGSTSLTVIPDEIFDKLGLSPVPFKLTESMGWHVFDHHAKELKLKNISDAINFVLSIINNVDTVRLGRDNSYIFSIENGRKKVGHRAVAIIVDSRTGEFMGIRTAGYESLKNIKERPLLWTRGTLTVSEDVATSPISTIEPQQSDEDTGRTKEQSNSPSSESKDTQTSANEQTIGEKIAKAEAETDTEPTEAQKEAGNYKKGHVKIDGFDVTIENPKGSVRSGKDADGTPWSVTMNNTYGYIRGTEGVDGDHIDVYLSDNPTEGNVFVIDQVNSDGSFDEHKVMYGFNSAEEARDAYLANYSPGWQGLGTITEVTKDEFKKWVGSSHRKTKPFAEYKSVNKANGTNEPNTPRPKKGESAVEYTRRLAEVKINNEKILADEAHEAFSEIMSKSSHNVEINNGEVSETDNTLYAPIRVDGRRTNLSLYQEEPAHSNEEPIIGVSYYREGLTYQEASDLSEEYNRHVGEDVCSDGNDELAINFNSIDEAVRFEEWLKNRQNDGVRFRKADDEISDFAQKHNLNRADVEAYADYMGRENLNGAARAFHEIRRKVRLDNQGASLGQFTKIFSPIEKELYEKFGNIDDLRQQYVQKTLDERNAMEAARKRAEEAAEAERRRLQEFQDMSDEQLDSEYIKAVEENDEGRMRDLVNEAARRKGYDDIQSDYQGVGAWAAPSNPGYESDEERREALQADGTDVNVTDIAEGYSSQPDDYFTNLRAYGNDTPHGKESAKAINDALEEIRRGNNPKIKVYRAVPKSVNEGRMRNGDWVTPSRKYAEMHGDNRLEGDYRIIEQEVPANELWWDGNDINEWGFDDGKGYAYRNTKNNRKLNDLITKDDGGNIIPLSQRFNARKSDVRYNKDRKRSLSAEEAAIRDAVVDRLREYGLEVITDAEEGQRVLDEANGRGERVRTQAALNGLKKASDFILSALSEKTKQRRARIEIPERANRLAEEAIGHPIKSHAININELTHIKKRHGENGTANDANSIPLRDKDIALMPYIMAAPTRVVKGNMAANGTESVRYEKDLENGVVVVVEREGRFDVEDMENITMWANKKPATNVTVATKTSHSTSETIVISEADAAKIRKDAETAIENDGKIREHRVYHGSAADFEAFDHSHMGEGEGAQAYGWGSYVTEVKGIGKSYATSNEEKRAKLSISEKKEYIKRRKRDIKEMGDYERYAKKIMRNRRNSEKEYKAAKKAGNEQDMRFYEDLMAISDSQLKRENHKALIDSFYDDINKAQSEIDELEAKFKGNHHLYTVEIPDDTGENYLDWDKPLPQSLDKGNIAERVFVDVRPDVASDDVELEMLDRNIKDSIDDADTGKKLYKAISLYEGDKAASEVLADFGFTGIKYPADYQRGGREDGAQNYVIFNENDLKITGHVRFFRTADGEAYGFTVGGKIYIDPRVATVDTPIHEYAHLWASALRQGNQEEWRNVVGLMKGTPVWEEVKRKYPELTTDDEIADEVLATYSGRRGAERLKEEARKATSGKPVTEAARAVTAIGRVREALRKFWQNVADFLHIHYTNAEEVADRVMRDLLEGVNPAEATINNEKSEEISDNGNKELSLRQKSNANGIPEQVSQGEHGTLPEEDRRLAEVSDGVARGSRLYEKEHGGGRADVAGLFAEQRAAERLAKENGYWLPMDEVMGMGVPGPSGNESDTYISGGTIYKVNNLLNSGGIVRLLDKIRLHNRLFPNTRYDFVGFTGYDGRSVYPVFSQKMVEGARPASVETIDRYMSELSFKKTGDGRYAKNGYEVWDIVPKNVLEDADGDIYVVDAELAASNAEATINNEKGSAGRTGNEANEPDEADTQRMDDIRFSKAEETEGTEPLSASLVDAWDTLVKSFKFQFRETEVDYLTAVEKFQDLVAKHSGKEITEFENAYDWMTFLSSKNRQEMDMFDSLIVTPMNKAINELTGEKKGLKKWNWDEGPLRDLVMYVEAKHGTDRNRQMAVEEAVKDAEDKETLLKEWTGTKKRINGQENVSWTEKQRQLDEAAHGIGADLTEDYSGLSSVFGDEEAYPKGWIQEAVEYVERYENSHDRKHIENLWAAIDNATGFTLFKQQETGLVSREYVERQKERFDNYIPLRGFADEVAGDVYNYIENDFYPGGNPVKTAHGRESEAGNPFGSILNTAYSTISVGNKNMAKQALYSLVMNHDTGGLAVARRAWMVNYEKLMSTPELRGIVVTPQLDGDTETPEWVEAVPRIPGKATAEERTRMLNDFESVMKRYQKDKAAKPVNKKAKTAYRTLYKERSEHDIPLFIGGNKYVITITGNPRVAQAMNGMLNPDVDNDTLTEMAKKVQRFMSGAFTAKNAAFSIANLTKDTIYSNNQVFIRENPKYWLKFTKNQKLGFGAYPQMMRRLTKYNDGKLDMNDKDDRLFKEFMDNGGATGYTFVNTQEEYAKELADKLKELSKKTPKALSVKGLYHIVFDAIEFAGQSAELVNRFAAYKTSREMGRAINRSVRDAKEITVNFNRKGAGRKSADKNKPWYAPINIASALSQYGRTSIIFWNANMQAKYRFYKNLREHPIKTSTTLIANSMAFGAVVMPLLNNMFLPALYEAFGMGGDDDKEDYFNALTDWERTHNLCIRLPKGWWLKIPLSPEMTPWFTMGDAIGGAASGQRDLSAGDFIKSTVDAVSPLSINWSYEDRYALLNVMPSVSQPLFQNMMNVNFMGSPIKKTPFTREQGYDPEYKMVYSSASPTLVALSRRWNRLVGGEDTKTAGAWLDWNPATVQNIISGYTGGYGTTFLSLADLIVNTANGEEKAVAFSRIPLVSRFAISGNKDMKLKRINSRYDDVRKYIIEFDHDYKAYEDEIDDGIEKKDALRTAEYMRKLDELENSERASLYDDLIEVADSVVDFEDYLKDFPDDEVTRNMLYEIKMRAIDILNGKDKEKNAEKK